MNQEKRKFFEIEEGEFINLYDIKKFSIIVDQGKQTLRIEGYDGKIRGIPSSSFTISEFKKAMLSL